MARVYYGPAPGGRRRGHYRVAVYEDGKLSLGVVKYRTYAEAKEAATNGRLWGYGPASVVFVRDRRRGRSVE